MSNRNQIVIIWIAALVAGIGCFVFIGSALAANRSAVCGTDVTCDPAINIDTQKMDQPCTGHETAGRCSDKCPPGSYSIGFDKANGSAICKNDPTGCPYGDSIPLGPQCDKQKPREVVTPGVDPTMTTSSQEPVTNQVDYTFVGK